MIKTACYALYVLFHPIDGFWDLKHHMKKTFGAANLILALLCAASVLSVHLYSFHFGLLDRDGVNVLYNISSYVLPLLAWTVINWAFSTLFDGKATMKQIWVQSVYSLTPMLLSAPILIILSHFMTLGESAFFRLIEAVAILWSAFLFLFGNMTIQAYTLGKTLLMAVFTAAGIAAAIFIGIILFSTFQQFISFVATVFTEFRYMQ